MVRISTLLAAIMTLLLLTACATAAPAAPAPPAAAPTTPPGFPRTVTDGAGRQLTLDAPPQRLVTYYNDSFGMLATLGIMPAAQSINPEMLTDPIYFGAAGADIPSIRYDNAPNLEDVAAAQPDLVFVFSADEATALEGIAPAFVTPDPANLAELYDALRLYGQVLGQEAAAEAAITAFQNRLNAYAKANEANAQLTILKLASYDGQFSVATTSDPVCQMLDVVATCAWAAQDDGWSYTTSIEGVLALNPDIIIYNNWTDQPDEVIRAELEANPLWAELRAVQNGRVYSTPGYNNPIASSLPAAQKVLDTYMPLMFPEIFDGPLRDEEVQEILTGEEATSHYGITDIHGNTLTFDAPPTRFFSYGNRDIEMLAALGIEPVGVIDVDHLQSMIQNPAYFPQPVNTITVPYNESWQPDIETLLTMNLDVVFGDDELRMMAEDVELNVYAFYANNGPSNWREGIAELRNLAALTSREEQAARVIQQFEERLTAYKAVAPDDRSVMVVGVTEDEYYISTNISGRCNLIIEVATCPWPDPTGGTSRSYTTNPEGLLELDPDFIIMDNWGEWSDEEMNAALAADPLWNELRAVKAGRVTPILGEYAYIQGIGPIGNIQWLDLYMPVIYPEAFPDGPLTDEEVAEFVGQ